MSGFAALYSTCLLENDNMNIDHDILSFVGTAGRSDRAFLAKPDEMNIIGARQIIANTADIVRIL